MTHWRNICRSFAQELQGDVRSRQFCWCTTGLTEICESKDKASPFKWEGKPTSVSDGLLGEAGFPAGFALFVQRYQLHNQAGRRGELFRAALYATRLGCVPTARHDAYRSDFRRKPGKARYCSTEDDNDHVIGAA